MELLQLQEQLLGTQKLFTSSQEQAGIDRIVVAVAGVRIENAKPAVDRDRSRQRR